MKTINLSIPFDPGMISAAIRYLTGLQNGSEVETTIEEVETIASGGGATVPGPEGGYIPAPPADIIATVAEAVGVTTDDLTAEIPHTPGLLDGVDVDAAGMPWDNRIHGAKRAKTVKDGLWKKKRGVSPDLVATVEAELTAAMSAPAAPTYVAPADTSAPPPPPPANDAPPPPPPPAPAPAVITRRTPDGATYTETVLLANGWTEDNIINLPIVAEAAPAAPGPAGVVETLTFPLLMAKITQALAAGTITQAAVDAAVTGVGLASMPLVATRPDLIPAIDAALFNV
jgi:hypothetical protein